MKTFIKILLMTFLTNCALKSLPDPSQIVQELRIGGYVEINNATDFNNMRYNLDGSSLRDEKGNQIRAGVNCPCTGYKLTANIDLTSYSANQGWIPLGTLDAPFNANIDGNGFIISNLYINNNKDYQGLVGVLNSGVTLTNIALTNVNINAASRTGSIAGLTYPISFVTNSYVSGGAVIGSFSVGGLVGTNEGEVSHSWSSVNVWSTSSYTTSPFSATKYYCPNCGYTGGIVGYSLGPIFNCYSLGNIFSNSNYVGGIVGYIDTTNSWVSGVYSVGSNVIIHSNTFGVFTDSSLPKLNSNQTILKFFGPLVGYISNVNLINNALWNRDAPTLFQESSIRAFTEPYCHRFIAPDSNAASNCMSLPDFEWDENIRVCINTPETKIIKDNILKGIANPYSSCFSGKYQVSPPKCNDEHFNNITDIFSLEYYNYLKTNCIGNFIYTVNLNQSTSYGNVNLKAQTIYGLTQNSWFSNQIPVNAYREIYRVFTSNTTTNISYCNDPKINTELISSEQLSSCYNTFAFDSNIRIENLLGSAFQSALNRGPRLRKKESTDLVGGQ